MQPDELPASQRNAGKTGQGNHDPVQPPCVMATEAQGPPGGGQRHYWGQALQYLEAAADVAPGKKVLLIVKRDGGQVRFRV